MLKVNLNTDNTVLENGYNISSLDQICIEMEDTSSMIDEFSKAGMYKEAVVLGKIGEAKLEAAMNYLVENVIPIIEGQVNADTEIKSNYMKEDKETRKVLSSFVIKLQTKYNEFKTFEDKLNEKFKKIGSPAQAKEAKSILSGIDTALRKFVTISKEATRARITSALQFYGFLKTIVNALFIVLAFCIHPIFGTIVTMLTAYSIISKQMSITQTKIEAKTNFFVIADNVKYIEADDNPKNMLKDLHMTLKYANDLVEQGEKALDRWKREYCGTSRTQEEIKARVKDRNDRRKDRMIRDGIRNVNYYN